MANYKRKSSRMHASNRRGWRNLEQRAMDRGKTKEEVNKFPFTERNDNYMHVHAQIRRARRQNKLQVGKLLTEVEDFDNAFWDDGRKPLMIW